jgi:hypothetical protein
MSCLVNDVEIISLWDKYLPHLNILYCDVYFHYDKVILNVAQTVQ